MKSNHSKNLALLLITLLLLTAAPILASERTETYDLSPGGKIEFDLDDGGSIHVAGWDKSRAEITFTDGKRDIEDYDIRIKETRDGLKISASLASRRDNYTNLRVNVMVPKKVDVEFHTAGGGITLEGIEGTFTGKTMGGGISIESVKGDINIKTMGGDIEVLDSEVDGKIHTMGGPVLVKDVVGNIRATSNGGDVRFINVRKKGGGIRGPKDLDRDDEKITGETVQITTMGGSINVDEAPDGAIVQTAGGSIRVRNADQFVDAQTGGGDIYIHVKSGWVEASTGAGDVDIVIESDASGDGDVKVSTGTGDVTVTVPSGFSMEFDIDLGYTRNSDRDYSIISDFDFDELRTREWDSDNGSPRKHIYGTGKINNGRHLIKIRTVNGNVRIKEAK